MSYEIKVSSDIDIHETGFKGNEIKLPYKDLVNLLGNPSDGDGYKVDAQWCFKDKAGTVATLYNWKNGPNYTGQGRIEDIKHWHIGGNYKRPASESLMIVIDALVERGFSKDIRLSELLENT